MTQAQQNQNTVDELAYLAGWRFGHKRFADELASGKTIGVSVPPEWTGRFWYEDRWSQGQADGYARARMDSDMIADTEAIMDQCDAADPQELFAPAPKPKPQNSKFKKLAIVFAVGAVLFACSGCASQLAKRFENAFDPGARLQDKFNGL